MDVLPLLALVAAVGGTWGWGWRQNRRLRAATAEAAARLDGRYEPGTHTSGGTLYGKCDGRDVVFIFRLSTSSRPESTTVVAVLRKPVPEKLLLKGRDAVARAPRLGPYNRWHSRLFGRLELGAESTQLWVKVSGVVRDASRLVELASVVAALAAEVEAR